MQLMAGQRSDQGSPKTTPISVTYRLGEADFLAAQRLSLRTAPSRRLGVLLIVLPAVGCVLAAGEALTGRIPEAAGALAGAALLALYRWWILPRAWRRSYRADPRWRHDITVTATADELAFDTALSHAVVRWAAFSHYAETERLLVLFQNRVANILPKTAFTPEEMDRFQELVRAHLPTARGKAALLSTQR
jgi:hypothetical protein